MAGIEKAAGRLNLWSALIERAGKLANALGWEITPAKVLGAVLPTAALVVNMIYQYVPWYIIVPVGAFALGSILHLYAGVARAAAVQGVKKMSLADAAALCEKVAADFYDFVEARAEEVAGFSNYGRRGRMTKALRKLSERSQEQIAQSLGVKQPAIVKIEKQTDLYLSTLRRFVEAAGGTLELRVELPGKGTMHLTGIGI